MERTKTHLYLSLLAIQPASRRPLSDSKKTLLPKCFNIFFNSCSLIVSPLIRFELRMLSNFNWQYRSLSAVFAKLLGGLSILKDSTHFEISAPTRIINQET